MTESKEPNKIRSYRDLIAWQKAMKLVVSVYQETVRFPREELFGLCSQLRRAAVSIPSNIAEGRGRHTTKDFLHFLSIANGSLNEMETQLLIAQQLGYVAEPKTSELLAQSAEVGRLINGLRRSLTPDP